MTVTVKAITNTANPAGGPPLAAGDIAQVDDSDVDVQALIRGGYLVRVDEQGAPLWSGTPDDSWTKDQLRQYADEQGISVADNATKADILAAIDQPGPAPGV